MTNKQILYCRHPESARQGLALEYSGGSHGYVYWCSICGALSEEDGTYSWTKPKLVRVARDMAKYTKTIGTVKSVINRVCKEGKEKEAKALKALSTKASKKFKTLTTKQINSALKEGKIARDEVERIMSIVPGSYTRK